MSRIAVEGLERLLQAGLEAGKGRLAAGDEEYAERFFILGLAYDPAHRSRFTPWLEALAGIRMIDGYLAQSNCQAAIRTAECLWETHQHRQALRGALLRRLEKVRWQTPDDVKEILDNLVTRIKEQRLAEALEEWLQRQSEELESRLAPIQRLREQATEFEGKEPYATRIRTTLLELALQTCDDVLMTTPDNRLARRYRAELQDSLQAVIRAQDSRWASSVLHVAEMLLERDELDQAEAMLQHLTPLNAKAQQSMAARTEELRQQIVVRREKRLEDERRRQEEERRKIQQQIDGFTQRHSLWRRYELPRLIEGIEEGERLLAQARAMDVADADLERQMGGMCQRCDLLRHRMIAAWQLVEEKQFEQALQSLKELDQAGLTVIVGPNGEQESLKGFIAEVVAEGDRHFEPQAREEIRTAETLSDPRDGVKHLQDFLQNLPRWYAGSKKAVQEAVQTLQQRASRWVDAERRIQLASSEYDPADRLVRLTQVKELYPEYPGLDEKIAKTERQKEAQELVRQAQACITDGRSSLNRHAVSEAEARCNEATEILEKAVEMYPELGPRYRHLTQQIERLSRDVEDAKQ